MYVSYYYYKDRYKNKHFKVICSHSKLPRKYLYTGWELKKIKGNNLLILNHNLPLDAHVFEDTVIFHWFGITAS